MATTLSFGTAGIRAAMGEGPDRMNATTVRTLALALGDYLTVCFPDARMLGICLAFDGRAHSQDFAQASAEVLLALGFVVHRFDQPTPTPVLAFCTRKRDAAAGIMITASHNPAADNGIKVYFRGGAQVLAPHDREIALRMHALVDADARPRMTLAEGRARGHVHELGTPELSEYLLAVESLLKPSTEPWDLSIAYTAMCGVGSPITHALLSRRKVRAFHEVEEQREPSVDFGGLLSPNPEHPAAIAQVLALAERESCELAFAHDPDADRLAVIARDLTGGLRVLSGDEVGSLLAESMLARCEDPAQALLVSTIVSSELVAQIAQSYGAAFEQTLTGFKWIAARARQLEREQTLRFVFGYEEALGYAFGALGDDKDGIAAMAVMLELADALKVRGSSLCAELERLARKHGLFVSRQLTFNATSEPGMTRLLETMQQLRMTPPDRWLGAPATLRDYALEPEAANVLVLRSGEHRLCVRPSGTEPKLKLYLHARVLAAGHEGFAQWQARAGLVLDRLEAQARALVAL